MYIYVNIYEIMSRCVNHKPDFDKIKNIFTDFNQALGSFIFVLLQN